MNDRTVRLKILRYKPGHMDPPRFQEFTVAVTRTMSVPGLSSKKSGSSRTPASCTGTPATTGSCGTCACRINGREQLACTTLAAELEGGRATLEPLAGFTVLGDLVVDMAPFFQCHAGELGAICDLRKTPDPPAWPRGIDRFERFENCIECGACVSACPVMRKTDAFMGPAAPGCHQRRASQKPVPRILWPLPAAGGESGGASGALACSRACPTGVFPRPGTSPTSGACCKKAIKPTDTRYRLCFDGPACRRLCARTVQPVRVIGNQSVHPPIDQPCHGRFVVDHPRQHFQAVFMTAADEPFTDIAIFGRDDIGAHGQGFADDPSPSDAHPQSQQRELKRCGLEKGGRLNVAIQTPDLRQDAVNERLHGRPFRHAGRFDGLDHQAGRFADRLW